MKTSDFLYDLPEDRIAQTPIEPRDHSRLMVIDRATDEIKHLHFYDILNELNPGDALVAMVWNSELVPVPATSGIANSYNNTIWSASALTRYPLLNPEPVLNAEFIPPREKVDLYDDALFSRFEDDKIFAGLYDENGNRTRD